MFYHALTGTGSAPVEDLEPVLLWTNPSPSSTFAAQTVSLNLTDYSGVIIEYKYSTGSDRIVSRSYFKKTDDLTTFGSGFAESPSVYARNVIGITNSGVEFGGCYAANGLIDTAFIPIKIYGVKEYVVESVKVKTINN